GDGEGPFDRYEHQHEVEAAADVMVVVLAGKNADMAAQRGEVVRKRRAARGFVGGIHEGVEGLQRHFRIDDDNIAVRQQDLDIGSQPRAIFGLVRFLHAELLAFAQAGLFEDRGQDHLAPGALRLRIALQGACEIIGFLADGDARRGEIADLLDQLGAVLDHALLEFDDLVAERFEERIDLLAILFGEGLPMRLQHLAGERLELVAHLLARRLQLIEALAVLPALFGGSGGRGGIAGVQRAELLLQRLEARTLLDKLLPEAEELRLLVLQLLTGAGPEIGERIGGRLRNNFAAPPHHQDNDDADKECPGHEGRRNGEFAGHAMLSPAGTLAWRERVANLFSGAFHVPMESEREVQVSELSRFRTAKAASNSAGNAPVDRWSKTPHIVGKLLSSYRQVFRRCPSVPSSSCPTRACARWQIPSTRSTTASRSWPRTCSIRCMRRRVSALRRRRSGR